MNRVEALYKPMQMTLEEMKNTANVIRESLKVGEFEDMDKFIENTCEDVHALINLNKGEFFHGSRDFYNMM